MPLACYEHDSGEDQHMKQPHEGCGDRKPATAANARNLSKAKLDLTPCDFGLDQHEMMFDVVVLPRSERAKELLTLAIQASGDTPAAFLNQQIVAAIECEEDWLSRDKAGRYYFKDRILKRKPISIGAPRTYLVQLDEATEVKFADAARRYGVTAARLIAGSAANTAVTNQYTDTELDPEVVIDLLEASTPA